MISREFQMNRAAIPRSELMKYQGEWVAFSSDGCRIVAHGSTFEELGSRLDAMGIDAHSVVFGSVPGPEDDCCIGVGD